jgi:hypothetical protein
MGTDAPKLVTLRRFAEPAYWLFDTPKGCHQASRRRAALVRDPAFQAVPELVNSWPEPLATRLSR